MRRQAEFELQAPFQGAQAGCRCEAQPSPATLGAIAQAQKGLTRFV